MGVSPRSRWSARSSTAWIAYSPFAEMRTLRLGSLEQARSVAGEVGDHDVGAGAADGGERLHHRALLVEPAQAPGRADPRVLAGDRVCREPDAELRPRPRDDVDGPRRRPEHDDVGP